MDDFQTALTTMLTPAANASLERWHQLVAQRDMTLLSELLHDDVVFRSPMAHRPYSGAPAVSLILSTVITIFENFVYHRQFATPDGLQVILEFSAEVDGKALKGIDMIGFDQLGKIIDFEVMIRPFNALAALGKEMGARIGAQLEASKIS